MINSRFLFIILTFLSSTAILVLASSMKMIPFLTVSNYDDMTAKDRVAIIHSGYITRGSIGWKIPSLELSLLRNNNSIPQCHLRFYGLTLDLNRNRLQSQQATLTSSEFSQHLNCYYLTNYYTYTDLNVCCIEPLTLPLSSHLP